ncbi:cell division protein FtsA [Caloranaerobacter azorensis DSM 13643]|uniref:Chaperone protein DnaK n=1 Tax=Caloranaerobacter azorensis DSM 13643 TaxID=1121264 RepID=A0A1M5UBL9_9FIRM|nr:cell division FtsA domain-containing protein [Caloranaerobacter azorensis]SHH60236.1 cell division protein FtsA [Caloranaerobacter azorensis DSM 13643]
MGYKFSNIDKERVIFSLDIGTRTVIGLVGVCDEKGIFKIIASEIREHEERSMYDGQIHDINGVAKIVKEVKQSLESKIGKELDKVAIAAAGRALKTCRVRVDRDIDIGTEIDKTIIESLEMEAMQKAQELIETNKVIGESKYYCVGYTVVNYYLDDNFIENLEGHRGSKIGVDLLATFLPHVVVDSLYTVMNRVNLEVINITLEPIAAINVAIKKNLRLLNLALVDIGAGTSDIAITKDGTIVAYAMTSIAGDEITEQIAKTYLLDYDAAEKLKINLNKETKHKFTDIVGIEHELTSEEILDSIIETIENLAKEIAKRILEYNDKSPSAVFLIGGGSNIPRLPELIANFLGLPKERVVIRDTSSIENVEGIPEELNGPHAITPIGIAITAIQSKYKDFLEIIVNGKKVKLLNSKRVKVSDVLVLIGYNPRNLIPKRGDNFKCFINGKEKIIKGEIGEPAKIFVNRKPANLEYKLDNGDEIILKAATKGKKAVPRLYDLVNVNKCVFLNGEKMNLIKKVIVNGKSIDDNVIINENDEIVYDEIKTLFELLVEHNINTEENEIFINGNKVSGDCELKNNDEISVEIKKEKDAEKNSGHNTITLKINGEVKVISYEKDSFIFVDIFDYIDFDLSKPMGMLKLEVNGKKAELMQELKNGDIINIYWAK